MLLQRIYFDNNNNNNNNNVTTITIKIVQEKRLKLENTTLIITDYKKLKNLIIKAKRLTIATQANTNCRNKIYKIYNNNQILLKIIKTIKSITN